MESLGFHCIKVPGPRGISNFYDPVLDCLLKGNVKILILSFFFSFFLSTLSILFEAIDTNLPTILITLSTIRSVRDRIQFFSKKNRFQNGGETSLFPFESLLLFNSIKFDNSRTRIIRILFSNFSLLEGIFIRNQMEANGLFFFFNRVSRPINYGRFAAARFNTCKD